MYFRISFILLLWAIMLSGCSSTEISQIDTDGDTADHVDQQDQADTQCTPGDRSCASDGMSRIVCNDEGTWDVAGMCDEGSRCEEGACVAVTADGDDDIPAETESPEADAEQDVPAELEADPEPAEAEADPEPEAEAETDIPTQCEINGGLCVPDACPDGMAASGTPLGCPAVCCVPQAPQTCEDLGGYCNMPQWDTSDAYPCDAAYQPTETSLGCEAQWQWCCAAIGTQTCVPEGRMGDNRDSVTGNDQCCEGLAQIDNRWRTNDGGCEDGPAGTFLCTDCGNGVCDLYENKCNCSDCAQAGSCTPNGTDCPATTCRNRNSLLPWIESECIQLTYECNPESLYCLYTEHSYSNMICNMNTGNCEAIQR